MVPMFCHFVELVCTISAVKVYHFDIELNRVFVLNARIIPCFLLTVKIIINTREMVRLMWHRWGEICFQESEGDYWRFLGDNFTSQTVYKAGSFPKGKLIMRKLKNGDEKFYYSGLRRFFSFLRKLWAQWNHLNLI